MKILIKKIKLFLFFLYFFNKKNKNPKDNFYIGNHDFFNCKKNIYIKNTFILVTETIHNNGIEFLIFNNIKFFICIHGNNNNKILYETTKRRIK